MLAKGEDSAGSLGIAALADGESDPCAVVRTAIQTAALAGSPPSNCLGTKSWARLAAALDLSPRQLEITQCIFDGLSEPAIGRLLGVTASTVHTHLDRLYRKLHVHGRCELVVAIFIHYLSLVGVDSGRERRAPSTASSKGLPEALQPASRQ